MIASGVAPGALARVLGGELVGTWFPARGELAAKRRWIAFAAKARGLLELDAGAVSALEERGASLLAAGVRRVRSVTAVGAASSPAAYPGAGGLSNISSMTA